MRIDVLGTEVGDADLDALTDVLVDAVDAGGSVSFLPPLAPADARAWWVSTLASRGPRAAVLVARDEAGAIHGAVMLAPAWAPNQPHRAEVCKLLVHRRARRHGVARALMAALEREARAAGFTLLTLDSATGGPAEAFYRADGWTEAGVIPRYAVDGAGGYVDTMYFYRFLTPA